MFRFSQFDSVFRGHDSPEPVFVIEFAKIFLKNVVIFLNMLEILREHEREQHVHHLAHADGKDRAAEVEVLDGVCDVDVFVGVMRKRRVF